MSARSCLCALCGLPGTVIFHDSGLAICRPCWIDRRGKVEDLLRWVKHGGDPWTAGQWVRGANLSI